MSLCPGNRLEDNTPGQQRPVRSFKILEKHDSSLIPGGLGEGFQRETIEGVAVPTHSSSYCKPRTLPPRGDEFSRFVAGQGSAWESGQEPPGQSPGSSCFQEASSREAAGVQAVWGESSLDRHRQLQEERAKYEAVQAPEHHSPIPWSLGATCSAQGPQRAVLRLAPSLPRHTD